jgi:hypothetical protein
MNILHVMRVFHGSIDWAWAFVRVPVLRSLPAVVTENAASPSVCWNLSYVGGRSAVIWNLSLPMEVKNT